METLAVIRQVFEEESLSLTWVFEWQSTNSPRPEKARQVMRKVMSMLIVFYDIKEVVHKEYVQAKQSILYPAVTFYGEYL
jgi:hypothetical protein